MPKINLADVTSGFGQGAKINANNALIEAQFDNCLSRDGAAPNFMSSDLDMNSNEVINIKAGQASSSAAQVGQISAAVSTALTGAEQVAALTNTLQGTHSATGKGAVDDYAALAAMNSAGAGYAEAGTYRVSTNLTLDSAIILAPGAILKPDVGVTITITGGLSMDDSQHFATGGGNVVVKSRSFIVPEWWGAAGDGVADDDAAVVQAVYSAKNGAGWLHFPKIGYRFTTDIVYPFASTLKITGAGRNKTFLYYEGTGFGVDCDDGTDLGQGHLLQDLTIQGYGMTLYSTNMSNTAEGAIRWRYTQAACVDRVNVYGFVQAGKVPVVVDATNSGTVLGCWRNCLSNMRVRRCTNGILLTGTAGNGQPNENTLLNVKVTSLSADTDVAYTSGICFDVNSGNCITLIACEADGRDQQGTPNRNKGFNFTGTSTKNITLINPRMEECSTGITTDANIQAKTMVIVNPCYVACTVNESFAKQPQVIKQDGALCIGDAFTNLPNFDVFLDVDNNASDESVRIYADDELTGAPTLLAELGTDLELKSGGIGVFGKTAPGAQPAKVTDPTDLAECITAITALIDIVEGAGLAADA